MNHTLLKWIIIKLHLYIYQLTHYNAGMYELRHINQEYNREYKQNNSIYEYKK